MRPQILTFLSFKDYGRPFTRGMTVPPDYIRREPQRGASVCSELWSFKKKIYIEPAEGVGIVCITDDPEKEPVIFLLDKPVEIKENIYFCVIV